VANQELVKTAKSAKTELDGAAAKVMASKIAQIRSKIIPLEFIPMWGRITLTLVPAGKLCQSLAIIALGILGGAAVGSQVSEELVQPRVWRR